MATNLKLVENKDENKVPIKLDMNPNNQKQLIIELTKHFKIKNKISQDDNDIDDCNNIDNEEDRKKTNVSTDLDQTLNDKNDKKEKQVETTKQRKESTDDSNEKDTRSNSYYYLNKPTNLIRHFSTLTKNLSPNTNSNNNKIKSTKSLSLNTESKFEQDISNSDICKSSTATRNISISNESSCDEQIEKLIINGENNTPKILLSPTSSTSTLPIANLNSSKKEKQNYKFNSLKQSLITDGFTKLIDYTFKYNNKTDSTSTIENEEDQNKLILNDTGSIDLIDAEYINNIQKTNSTGSFFFGQQNLANIFNKAITNLNPLNYNTNLNETLTATQYLEYVFGPELKSKLVCDNTKFFTIKKESKMDSIQLDSTDITNNDDANSSSVSSISKSSTSSLTLVTNNLQKNEENRTNTFNEDELNRKKKQKIDEYYHIEEKQANLLVVLNSNVYNSLKEENEKQQYRLCDKDEMNNVFHVVISLDKFALQVHQPMAAKIKLRVDQEWFEKPYFGDILTEYIHYYKIYKAILKTYPMCQLTLSKLLKKKQFAACLKKLLEAESEKLEKVNRLDMLLDRLVDLPRRNTQLLESYLKLLDTESKEYTDIKKVLNLLKDIFESSNDALNKTNNFKLCYELQYMIDPPLLDIVDQNRQLIKQGPLYKVAKRNGELLLRHLALFNDMLLVCKCDRLRRKLQLKYKIPADKITIVENSNENNELTFRLVSSDQNNEFKAERLKDKEDWLKAFQKVKDIKRVVNLENLDNKFSNDKASSYSKLGEVPPIWIKDSEQVMCSGCKEQFSFTRRRHHCRTCGRIYCFNCCSNFIPVKFNDFKQKVRVCRTCFNMLEPIYLNEMKKLSPESPNKIESPPEADKFEDQESPKIEDKNEDQNTKPIVIMRKSKNDLSDDNNSEKSRQSSSPLTEEQLKVVKEFLETSNHTTDNSKQDESDIETDDDLDDSNSTRSSNNDLENNNILRTDKPPVPPPRTKHLSHETNSNTNGVKYRSHNSTTNFKQNQKKEILLSDYGFLCKIPIVESDETILDDGLASTLNKKNNIWEKEYLVLNSDKTISVCSSSNHTNSPSLVIQLPSFTLKNLNESTFALTMQDKKDTLSLSSINLNQDQDNKQSPGKRIRDKFKMFESNYEIKFNNKDIKNKWFEMIKNEEYKD